MHACQERTELSMFCDAVQAHLAHLALGDIYAALEVHQDQADLQAKGLVALGVLGQVGLPACCAVQLDDQALAALFPFARPIG